MLKTIKLLTILVKHPSSSLLFSAKASHPCSGTTHHLFHPLIRSQYPEPCFQGLVEARSLGARFFCDPTPAPMPASPPPPTPPPRLLRPRGSLWRSRKGLSREAQQVVRDLRRYKAEPRRVALIFRTSVARLLKIDILAAMKELQRENEAKLALQIFNVIRKEYWYKPDIFLYKDMMNALAVSKQVHEVEKLFTDLKEEGLQPELNVYTELLRAYLYANVPSRVSEVVEEMKQAGHPPDELAHRLLWKYLARFGHRELAIKLRHEYNKTFEASSEDGAKL